MREFIVAIVNVHPHSSPDFIVAIVNVHPHSSPDLKRVGPRDVERHNLTIRMQHRRWIRPTNGFCMKWADRSAAFALQFAFGNFVRIRETLAMTPAMQAGLADRVWSVGAPIRNSAIAVPAQKEVGGRVDGAPLYGESLMTLERDDRYEFDGSRIAIQLLHLEEPFGLLLCGLTPRPQLPQSLIVRVIIDRATARPPSDDGVSEREMADLFARQWSAIGASITRRRPSLAGDSSEATLAIDFQPRKSTAYSLEIGGIASIRDCGRSAAEGVDRRALLRFPGGCIAREQRRLALRRIIRVGVGRPSGVAQRGHAATMRLS